MHVAETTDYRDILMVVKVVCIWTTDIINKRLQFAWQIFVLNSPSSATSDLQVPSGLFSMKTESNRRVDSLMYVKYGT